MTRNVLRGLGVLGGAVALVACASGEVEREGTPGGFNPPGGGYVPPASTTPPASTGTPNPAPTGTGVDNTPPTTVTPGNGATNGNNGNTGGTTPNPVPAAGETFGNATMGGAGQSSDRYHKAAVTRDGTNYFLMANGWGPGFTSQSISYNGTSFTVQSLQGSQGPMYQPASYPTVFCGKYSDSESGACGLPAALDSIAALDTGWSWSANGNMGQYNAAYDIWMGTSTERSSFSGYLMVWYREPVGQQPAGQPTQHRGITVANVPGTWDIWTGAVGGRPIINWVRAEGQDTPAMEFDIMDFVRDAQTRGLQVPGTHVLSVAVGFEIWNGPITNLASNDFYVDVIPK
jgi:glycosyl hydrolase family 12